MLAAAVPALAMNAIQAENAKPGDSYWQAALQDPVSSHPPIDGYADATSVRPGQTIGFHVSTSPAASYRIEISRLGWYGGSGGRRITCVEGLSDTNDQSQNLDSTCTHDEPGVQQPAAPPPDPVTGEVQAGWSETDSLTIPADWTSGYYLAVFRLTSGPDAGKTGFTPFIVQAPVGDHSTILVQVPTNTWLAYNQWGGEGVYTSPEAVDVSFNRPYSHRLLFSWEYPLVRFLERGGWDVSYATNDDVDADPSILLNHALDMSAGHDEYWTSRMRDGWEAARDAGVNLAFMGADDANWQVRYEDGRRTMVAYKYLPDPVTAADQTTTMFRNLYPPRPECELMGVEFQGTVDPGNYLPYTADAAVATDPWFAGSGIAPATVLAGLGGYEVDSITPGCHVPPVTPLLSYSGPAVKSNFNGDPTRADAARYTACSGAEVFAAGSLQFSWGLDSFRDPAYMDAPAPKSAGLQAAMTRALADLTISHVPRPGPPDICVPTPAFDLTAPSPWAAVGQALTLRSTSTDAYGEIGGEYWMLVGDGGAEAVTGPSLTRTFSRPGTARVALRVTDSSGAAATVLKTIRICACPAPPAAGEWPAGTQGGGRCGLTPFGSVRQIGNRYWFEPGAGVRRFSLTSERLTSSTGAITSAGVARRTADAVAEIPGAAPQTPLRVDIAARIDGRTLDQQFVLPARLRSRGVPRLRPVAAVTCNGTAGQVLTPAFGGPLSLPLEVAVTGGGRLTVTLSGPRVRPSVRHVRVTSGRTVIVSWPSARLPGGTYTVAVGAPRAWLPQPITLGAVRVVPARRHPVRSRHRRHP
jgi:hypothetical protein